MCYTGATARMFGIFFLVVCFAALLAFLVVSGERASTLGKALVVGFFLRLLLLAVVRNVQFFSHAVGGDAFLYEEFAQYIVDYWRHYGFSYITLDKIPAVGRTSLPPNLFALIVWANGGPSTIGCTALTALVACLTLLNFYKLAVEMGADPKIAQRVTLVLFFSPSFLMYTSDMYKDGLVWFFTLGAVGSAFRLSRKFSVLHLVIGVVSIFAVWFVRFYLVFVCIAPLVVGLLGIGGRSVLRPLFFSIVAAAVLGGIASYSNVIEDATKTANDTLEIAHSTRWWNSRGGSGVVFDDGGKASRMLYMKVLYTLLSPFPWTTGSIGLHIGKIDTGIWYYFMYRAIISARRLWRENKGLLVAFLSFLVPLTLAYATGMSNMGLILRQRMPIILIGALLATLSWPRAVETHDQEAEDDEAEEDEAETEDEDEPAADPTAA